MAVLPLIHLTGAADSLTQATHSPSSGSKQLAQSTLIFLQQGGPSAVTLIGSSKLSSHPTSELILTSLRLLHSCHLPVML